MIAEGNGKLPVFKIDYSVQLANEISKILNDARAVGIEQVVRSALATIFRRLRRDPLAFGELVKEYKHLKLLEHVAVVQPIVVRFGIHSDAQFVVISRIRLLPPGGAD